MAIGKDVEPTVRNNGTHRENWSVCITPFVKKVFDCGWASEKNRPYGQYFAMDITGCWRIIDARVVDKQKKRENANETVGRSTAV